MSMFLLDGKNNFANMMSKLTLLRRYCESVLYFNTKSRQLERVTEQVVFSLAAALAMALAMLIAFWSQQKYGNFSTSFLVAVVLGYIGKDRLKELGRNYTYLRMNKHMLDHVTNFSSKLSDREHKVGFVKEVVQFVEPNQLDDELEKYRDSRHKYNNGSCETVSMYRRRFYTEDKELPEGVERYADFSVFNLRKKLRNASWQDHPFYYQNGVMVVSHLVQPSYPIELVAGITRDGSVSYQRYTLTVTRKGIRQVRENTWVQNKVTKQPLNILSTDAAVTTSPHHEIRAIQQ